MVGFALRWWVPFVGVVGGSLATLSLEGDRHPGLGHPQLAFATVLALTVMCAGGAAAVIAAGLRRRLAEVGLLGNRDGMPAERAAAILRDGSDAQWPRSATDIVLAEIHAGGFAHASRLDRVGHAALYRVAEPREDPLAACLPYHSAITPAA